MNKYSYKKVGKYSYQLSHNGLYYKSDSSMLLAMINRFKVQSLAQVTTALQSRVTGNSGDTNNSAESGQGWTLV